VSSDRYWDWRDEQMKHPDGRAWGGEPCVVCQAPVPANAHWKHRDRHICSPKCNATNNRRFGRRLARGELVVPETQRPWSNGRDPILFSTVSDSEFPYTFTGLNPLPGDIVERHGSVTYYQRVQANPDDLAAAREQAKHDPDGLGWKVDVLTRGVECVHLQSGSTLVTTIDERGVLDRVTYYVTIPGSDQWSYAGVPFDAAEGQWVWTYQYIRDIAEDGHEYTFFAPVCVPYPVPLQLQQDTWTPAYQNRSARLRRISSSTAAHARRLRMTNVDGNIERIDPRAVYDEDCWTCRLCKEPVDPVLRAPHRMSASLDHIIPLAAGGAHTRPNVQTAHLICNIRKGARL